MEQCAEHVTFQLPNQFTRVGYLLDGIQCSDAGLQAAMAFVRNDDRAPNGKMHNFEATAAYLLPYDPVMKKRATQGTKRGIGNISDVSAGKEADISSATGSKKPAVGKTGVEFRFYKGPEYVKLTDEQKAELREYRAQRDSTSGKGSKNDRSKKGKGGVRFDEGEQKKWIAAAVQKQLSQQDSTAKEDEAQEDAFKKYIMSVVSEVQSKPTPKATAATATAVQTPVTLQSILRRAGQR